LLLTTGCLKFSAPDKSSSSNKSTTKTSSSNQKSVKDLLQDFKGGTIDLRAAGAFSITGNYDSQKLLTTNITIRGNGSLILKSSAAAVFNGTGRKFYLGANTFDFIEVEEFHQGVSVFTQFSGAKMNNIEYALKQ